MAGEDYNNIFSPDYWTPEGYAKRKAGQKQSSQKIANYQDTARQNEWGAIGDFFGGIGNFFANAGTDPNIGSNARSDSPFKRGAGVEASAKKVERDNSGGAFNRVAGPTEPINFAQQRDPLEDLYNLLNEKYSGSPVDTSFLNGALDAQLGAVNDARNLAQENFRTSDSNLAGMHNAFRNDILAQAPKIQEQNKQYQTDLTSIFDRTLQENADRQATNKAQDAEMFARLGIAPAANQPDLVGQAIEQGNQRAVGSRDARLAEAATIGNSELERNTSAANAVGAAGTQRRSDLNMRLQEILGDLGGREAEIRGNFAQAQGQAAQEAEQRAYERFIADRNWNMDRYNQEMQYRLDNTAQDTTVSGFNGLQATTDPQVQRAVNDVIATEPNLDIRNPNQVLIALRKKNPNMSPEGLDAALAYITNYNNLGSTNKFPVG